MSLSHKIQTNVTPLGLISLVSLTIFAAIQPNEYSMACKSQYYVCSINEIQSHQVNFPGYKDSGSFGLVIDIIIQVLDGGKQREDRMFRPKLGPEN